MKPWYGRVIKPLGKICSRLTYWKWLTSVSTLKFVFQLRAMISQFIMELME